MTRPTRDFETSGGHKIKIVTFATGRDFNAIQETYLEGAKVQMVAGTVAVDGFNVSADFKAKEKAIELFIVSIDDDTADIVNRVMDLPYNEVAEIHTELNELTSKKKLES